MEVNQKPKVICQAPGAGGRLTSCYSMGKRTLDFEQKGQGGFPCVKESHYDGPSPHLSRSQQRILVGDRHI